MTSTVNRRAFLSLAGGAAAAATLGGCSSSTSKNPTAQSSSADAGPITFWSNYSTTDSANKTKKPQDFWISQATARFTEKTGVQVVTQSLPGDATMFTKLRTASIGGKGPDVASVWSGTYMLSIKQFLEPMNDYWTKDEMGSLSGWAAVAEDQDVNGKLFGVPNGSDGAMTLGFDKRVLDKAGVDPSTWPVDFDTWLTDLDKIKSTGVTPLALGKAAYVLYVFDTFLAQAVGGPLGVGELNTGKRSFSSPELLDATQKWLKLRDYSLQGAPTTEDDAALQQVFAGKAAMQVGGAWNIPAIRKTFGSNAALAKLPTISATGIAGGTIGGTGVAFIVSKASKHKPAAVAFIKHLLSKDEQLTLAKANESAPLVGRTDVTDPYADALTNATRAWSVEKSDTFWPDNTLSSGLVEELTAQAQLVWSGKTTPEQFLANLDTKRKSLQ